MDTQPTKTHKEAPQGPSYSGPHIHRLTVTLQGHPVTYWETSKARLIAQARKLGVGGDVVQSLPCPSRGHEWVRFLNLHCGDLHG